MVKTYWIVLWRYLVITQHISVKCMHFGFNGRRATVQPISCLKFDSFTLWGRWPPKTTLEQVKRIFYLLHKSNKEIGILIIAQSRFHKITEDPPRVNQIICNCSRLWCVIISRHNALMCGWIGGGCGRGNIVYRKLRYAKWFL